VVAKSTAGIKLMLLKQQKLYDERL